VRRGKAAGGAKFNGWEAWLGGLAGKPGWKAWLGSLVASLDYRFGRMAAPYKLATFSLTWHCYKLWLVQYSLNLTPANLLV